MTEQTKTTKNQNILASIHLDNFLLTKDEFERKLTGCTRYIGARFVLEDPLGSLTAEINISANSNIYEIKNAIRTLREWVEDGLDIVTGTVWGDHGGILKLDLGEHHYDGFAWQLVFVDPPKKTFIECTNSDENYWDGEQ